MGFLNQHLSLPSQPTQNPTISFSPSSVYKKVKDKLKQKGLDSFVPVIEEIEKSSGGKLKKEAAKALQDILKAPDDIQLSQALGELKKIIEDYNKNKQIITQTTQTTISSNKGKVYKGLKWVDKKIKEIYDSPDLNAIQDIEIDGKVTIQEFLVRLNEYKQEIQQTAEFQKLSPQDQQKVLKSIDAIKTKIQSLQEVQLDFLNDKFDSYAKQIEKQLDTGKTKNIEVDFGNGNIIVFNDSKEAFEFIKTLKKEAELEFQDNIQTILEGIGNLLAKPLKFVFTDILSQPYKIAKKWVIDDILEDYDKDASGIEWTWDILWAFLAVAGSINYTETLFRRVLIDNLAKAELLKVNPFIRKKYDVYDKDGKKTGQKERRFKKLIIPDYGRDSAPQFFPNTEDANLYNEYLQRLSILDKLEAKINTLDGEKKQVFQKELEKIKSYLNINTDTFYLKALALEKEIGLPKRLYWVFRNGILNYKFHYNFIPFFARGLAQEAATEFNTNNGKLKEQLEKGIDYVFEDTNIKVGEKGEILGVEGDFKPSKNIEALIKYVEFNTNLTKDEKKEILNNIRNFLESLKTRPLPEETVKSRLLAIVEGKLLSRDSILKQIDEKYFKEEDIDKLKRSGILGWIKNMGDDLLALKNSFKEKLYEKWGKIAPASLTWEKAMAIKFRDMVEKGLWEGNKKDLEKVFKMIDSGKLELNINYPKWSKIKILKDLIINSYKYGLITGPKLTKLQRFLEYEKTSGLKKLIEDGNKFLESVKKAKELFKEGELGDNLRNIIELDNTRFPNEPENLEKEFKQMLDDLKAQVEAGKLTKEETQLELIKLYGGFLTKAKTLSILDSLDGDTKKKENVKHFKELIETGKWYGTKKELLDEIDRLKSDDGYRVSEKVVDTSRFSLEDVAKLISEKGKKLGEKHFKNLKFGIFEGDRFNFESYKQNELELAKVLHFDKSINLNSRLGQFLQTIQDGNAYTATEFFENLNKALDLDISVDEHTTRDNFEEDLRQKVSDFFDRLSPSEKTKLLYFIKTKRINKDVLSENIVKALDGKVDNIRSVIRSLRKEFEDGVDDERLKEIRKELTELLKQSGITEELKEEINNLKKEINDKLKANSSQETRNSSSETQEKMTPEEKMKRIEDLYKRAILYAELEGDYDKAQSLGRMFSAIDIENTTVKKQQGKIKSKLGLKTIKALGDYEDLMERKIKVLEELQEKGLVENIEVKNGDVNYKVKESKIIGDIPFEEKLKVKALELSEPKFVNYLIKAIKHGAR